MVVGYLTIWLTDTFGRHGVEVVCARTLPRKSSAIKWKPWQESIAPCGVPLRLSRAIIDIDFLTENVRYRRLGPDAHGRFGGRGICGPRRNTANGRRPDDGVPSRGDWSVRRGETGSGDGPHESPGRVRRRKA